MTTNKQSTPLFGVGRHWAVWLDDVEQPHDDELCKKVESALGCLGGMPVAVPASGSGTAVGPQGIVCSRCGTWYFWMHSCATGPA